jgi:hypothetical protein
MVPVGVFFFYYCCVKALEKAFVAKCPFQTAFDNAKQSIVGE